MNIDPAFKMTCKKFRVLVNGFIEFQECKIFNDMCHFKDILKEYEVKYCFQLKIWKEESAFILFG